MKKNKVSPLELSALRRRAEERLEKSGEKDKGGALSPAEMHRLIHELSVHQIELEMQQEELMQSRDEMEAGLERYTELYDFAPVGYLTLARDGTILEVNLTATKMLGVDRSLLKGARIALFLDPEGIKSFNALMERVFSHKEPHFCECMLVHEESALTLQRTVCIDAVVQDDGQSCRAVLSDVTHQKQIERENAALQATLVHAEKMESIGRLAGGVAHEINNMLQVMLGNIEILIATGDLDASMHLPLVDVRNSIMKSAEIVRKLLVFARKELVNPTKLDLNTSLKEMGERLECLLGDNIRLTFSLGEGLWSVDMYLPQIEQIMINLTLNARDAMKEGGDFFIATRNVQVDAPFSQSHPEIEPGDYVVVEVGDNGCGMDKETLDFVFEPFFTTKPMTEATGLGLAVVYGIVRQNLGAIFAHSTKGKGTTFEIYLPRSTSQDISLSQPDAVHEGFMP